VLPWPMAGYAPILQNIVRAKIGAPAPSCTRQAPPGARNRPAVARSAGERGGLMPAVKIAALLCSYSPKQRRGRGRRILISAVAAMCGSGLSRQTIYLARRGIMSERTRALLSHAISSIERGEVTFHRVAQEWRAKYHNIPPAAPPRTLDLDPDDPAAIIQKINDYGRRPKTMPVDLGPITINVCTGW
jgi:hypothetical protein